MSVFVVHRPFPDPPAVLALARVAGLKVAAVDAGDPLTRVLVPVGILVAVPRALHLLALSVGPPEGTAIGPAEGPIQHRVGEPVAWETGPFRFECQG